MFAHERSLVRKYEGRPFVFLGVNEDETRESLLAAQKKHKLNWRSWWDENSAIARRWKVDRFPTLFLIDQKGEIRWKSSGVPVTGEMDNLIEQMVAEAESEGSKQAALSRK